MMASAQLAEGVQYGLSNTSENKTLVYVKLTDSSIKAIDEYLRIKVRDKFKTTTNKFWSTHCPRNMSTEKRKKTSTFGLHFLFLL